MGKSLSEHGWTREEIEQEIRILKMEILVAENIASAGREKIKALEDELGTLPINYMQ